MKEKLQMRLLWDFSFSSAKHTDLPLPGQEKPRPSRDNCFWTDYVLAQQKDNKHGQIMVPLWWHSSCRGPEKDPRTLQIIRQRTNPLIASDKFTDFSVSEEGWLIFLFHMPKNAYFSLVAFRRGMKIITDVLGIPKDEVMRLRLQLTPFVKPAGTAKWIELKDFISSKTKFDGAIYLEA